MHPRIVQDPKLCSGEAVVRGTLIPVHVVLAHMAAGQSDEVILKTFPTIAHDDLIACIAYGADLAARVAGMQDVDETECAQKTGGHE